MFIEILPTLLVWWVFVFKIIRDKIIFMLVFIDDSGDPGFKFDKGSSEYFVISMVIFDDELEAEKIAVAIKELRRKIGFPDDVEFRFFRTSHNIRIKFLNHINQFKFKIRCLIVEKSKIHSLELRNNRESFYSYFIKEVLKYSGGSIRDARIRIDGSGDRTFRKSFLSYLRRELNYGDRCIVKNCKLVNSKNDVLIQLADMVAGSINRFNNKEKSDFEEYRSIIKKHIEDEWNFQ